MKYFCYQLGDYDCGFACLKMMLAYYYDSDSYLEWNNDKEVPYSFMDLKNLAHEKGLEINGVNVEDIQELYERKKSIVLIKENDLLHYVLFMEQNNDKIIVLDPKIGERELSAEEFENLFQGKALILEENKNEIKMNNRETKISIIFFTFSYVLDFLLITISTYFIHSQSSTILIMLLVFLLFVNTLMKIIYFNSYFSYFDKTYIYSFLKKRKILKREEYEDMLNYRTYSILFYIDILSKLLILAFLSYLLISDSLYHIAVIILIIIFSIVNHLYFKNKETNDELELQKLEQKLTTSESENLLEQYIHINNKSKKIINSKIAKNLLKIIYIVFFIYFIMKLNKINSYTYLIFYGFLYFELSKNIEYLFLIREKKNKINQMKNKFIALINKNDK